MNQLSTPIQVGLIGLGVSENSWAPGAWAYTSHLPAFLYSPHYVITALCNSSVTSAEASIHKHKLGADVKAYGNPSDIAADPNVDIVVIVVNV
jgi:predicted dehydrogenase